MSTVSDAILSLHTTIAPVIRVKLRYQAISVRASRMPYQTKSRAKHALTI